MYDALRTFHPRDVFTHVLYPPLLKGRCFQIAPVKCGQRRREAGQKMFDTLSPLVTIYPLLFPNVTSSWIEKEGKIHALLLRKANVSYYECRATLLGCP